ncbi:hypothetical protein [Aestuariicoccus sp. MJ-SS9]|uniref:hypothetical protein n=1 Tax=Aestuariicoccus sp. MJ-SS9 TaxID=3079855 RepID=UPI002908EE68|nr:hypothetical protein [Aestuariicoccus sp. MJ-SS9]MDU8912878.1 hypothetical protein [Aestuariicoccus sp. MJ-SS9]
MPLVDWIKNVHHQQDVWTKNRFSGAPLVTHAVSKSFKGEKRNDLIRTVCESPEKCAHVHFPGSFDCKSLELHRCDSEFSRKHLSGALKAGFEATFGQVDDAPFAQKDGKFIEDRGFFFGNFDIEDDRGNKIADGVIDGMVNVGIVREPLREPAEECHHVGRWYGRIHADVHLPEEERALLVGMLAFDVDYNLTPSALGIAFVGTLEGMLIRECRKGGRG